MSSTSGKQSRANRVEAVKAAQNHVIFGDEMPLHFDERQVRIYNRYVKQLLEKVNEYQKTV
jgi:hypothetical protein